MTCMAGSCAGPVYPCAPGRRRRALCHSLEMVTTVVRAACPHDCPDTCAMLVTVEDGRAIKVHGDPDHPPTHGALCTKVSRYAERTYHPERVLQPLKRVGPKGSGRFAPVSWDEALDDIAARLKAIAGRRRQRRGDRALQLRRHDGPGAGREHGGALLPPARRVAARPHDLLVGRRRGARRDLRRQGRHARRALRREPPDRHLGQQLDHLEPALLDLAQQAKRAGAKLVCIDPRRTETAEKCHEHIALLPGTDGALALGADARADRQRLARPRLHRAPRRRLAGAARARARMAAGARRRDLRHRRPTQVRALARDYGTTKPAAIRLNYGMQRVRGGGNATRLIALLPCLVGAWRHRAGGLLLSASGWFAPARDDAALQRPDLLAGRRPRTINMSTIGDDLLRESGERSPTARRSARRSRRSSSTTATRWRWRPSRRKVVARLRARGPVHGRARALHDRHRRPTPTTCCRRRRSSSTSTCTPATATPTR